MQFQLFLNCHHIHIQYKVTNICLAISLQFLDMDSGNFSRPQSAPATDGSSMIREAYAMIQAHAGARPKTTPSSSMAGPVGTPGGPSGAVEGLETPMKGPSERSSINFSDITGLHTSQASLGNVSLTQFLGSNRSSLNLNTPTPQQSLSQQSLNTAPTHPPARIGAITPTPSVHSQEGETEETEETEETDTETHETRETSE